MGEPTTFFKIDRQLINSEFWLSEPFTKPQAWVDLIGRANFADNTKFYKGDFCEVKRGQLPTSIRELASRWHWSQDKVRTFLRALERAEMATIDRSPKRTLVTIENYDKYQCDYRTNQCTNRAETERQPSGDRAASEHSPCTTPTHNKNNKERKEEEKKKEAVFSAPSSGGWVDEPTPPDVLAKIAECIGGLKI